MNANVAEQPEGIDPEILSAALARPFDDADKDGLGCDAYALWAAMTRLGHEVRLQGRAFASLREQLENGRASDPYAGNNGLEEKAAAIVAPALDAIRESVREAERRAEASRGRAARAEEELLETLTDVHDRLARGLDASRQLISRRAPGKGWLSRLLSRDAGTADAIASLMDGQELALRRVEDELARRGMREIIVLGEVFDPETMRVVATDASGGSPDGTVTAVVRGGWELGGTVWRAAEVVVARLRE